VLAGVATGAGELVIGEWQELWGRLSIIFLIAMFRRYEGLSE
jgi:hypothetical protein